MNEVQSKRFKLNQEDVTKILVGASIAMGGALLTYVAQIVTEIDFGVYSPMVVAISSILINAARKFIEGLNY